MPGEPSLIYQVARVSAGYGKHPVLHEVSVDVCAGEFLGVIGPNGSGKSTLLRCLAGALVPVSGDVLFDGYPLHDAGSPSRRAFARMVAGVPSELAPAFAFSAGEIVAMGRHPHVGLLGDLGPADRRAIAEAMAATATSDLAARPFDELSSGERQRVALAQALAQEPRVLLLDEPTAHLDLTHAIQLLDLLRRLQRERALTCVLISHDLNLAAEYADRLLLIDGGRVRACGTPAEVLDYRLLEDVYRTVIVVETNPISGRPRVVPVPGWALERRPREPMA